MLGPMAAKKAQKEPRRRKSLLTQAGESAQRGLLLGTLESKEWNLTATAEALEMAGPSDVLRAIKNLGLTEEYDAAKLAGKVSPGNRRS